MAISLQEAPFTRLVLRAKAWKSGIALVLTLGVCAKAGEFVSKATPDIANYRQRRIEAHAVICMLALCVNDAQVSPKATKHGRKGDARRDQLHQSRICKSWRTAFH